MKRFFLKRLLPALGFLALFSCGGGISGTPIPPAPSQPTETKNRQTSAILTLSTGVSGSIPAATTINSYIVTITLPSGVTVKSTMNSPETDAGVVTASGAASGATAVGRYAEETPASAGTLRVFIVKVDPVTGAGFDPGEFCIVKADISSDKDPATLSFPVPTLDDSTGFNAASATTVVDLEKELFLQAGIVFR